MSFKRLSKERAKKEQVAQKVSPAGMSVKERSASLHPLLKLQRTIGNQSLGQLLPEGKGPVRISDPQEASEREADRVAEQLTAEHELSVSSNGNQLPTDLSSILESGLGVKLQGVRVHNDSQAAEAARSVKARAFTIGNDIVFGAGEFSPTTSRGRKLIAHELTHVSQQSDGPAGPHASGSQIARQAGAASIIQRAPDEKAESKGEPRATDFKTIKMHFNGLELIVFGDNKEIFRFSGRSGRPVRISEEHAKECGANPVTDSYLSDKRFVGIKDHGPIPEGSYTLSPAGVERFTGGEQWKLLWGGIFGRQSEIIHGHPIHPGDWGEGRVALHPKGAVREGPCGSAKDRSAFFLHGGVLAGSSGCIDIGGDFDKLADFLSGFKKAIVLTVSYDRPPPSVGVFTGLGGAIAYTHFGYTHGPALRLGAEFAPTQNRAVASIGYDAVLQWAGGALSAGVRLDVPFTDRETFVRAGLTGGANFRIFGPLYGQLFGGYSWDISGPSRQSGPEAGAGLRLDLGRWELEAIYNVLRPASEDHRVHQALLGLGFRFGGGR